MSRPCPSCSGELREIHIIDKAHMGAHDVLEYTVAPNERSFWTSKFPVAGRILALMCQQCGTVQLYGQHYMTPEEVKRRAREQNAAAGRVSLADPSAKGGLSEPED